MKTPTKEMFEAINQEILSFERNQDKTEAYMMQYSEHEAICTPVCTVKSPNPDFRVLQGGCNDGKYLYVAFTRKVKDPVEGWLDTGTILVKADPKTGETIMYSDVYELHHTNDMTYLPEQNLLVVVHNKPCRDRLTIVDPETLKIVKEVKIERNIFAMAYNPKSRRYAVGKSGGQNFAILDENFNPVVDYEAIQTRFVTQGMECDDDYLYFIQFHNNCLMKYDWDGNFVEFIPLSEKALEPEHLSFLNGKLLIAYGEKCEARIFEITFKETK